jgi:type III pantothenate kinase
MNLVLDLGNSSSRLYLYKGKELVERRIILHALNQDILMQFMAGHEMDGSILSCVVDPELYIEDLMRESSAYFIRLNHQTPLPIENLYQTPETLGGDRLAGAVAAAALYPGTNVLIIDAGTCIKYDFVNAQNQYIGGSISPGYKMRFEALHQFTNKLPKLKAGHYGDTGNTTETAMKSGVFMGIVFEMKGFINFYKENKAVDKVILTGGDARHFANELNFPIFAEPDLTGIGLNEILSFNQVRP